MSTFQRVIAAEDAVVHSNERPVFTSTIALEGTGQSDERRPSVGL
ncbi:hypothetical protein PC129_g24630 [Phytophthora cactorum]|uniref:Uncharacterized protein n=1 Tax=Phytophthora cactorum TaxID=29920 RepID=A0A329RZL5_9STRA|nr:hypothetical protein Pcac1_g20391 [Phytophthora cactorum]KAG2768296.1 hypothetical protein Pcac1_g20390 [Phytophthora cactorum]KAG2768318.1 hypothetical protein Pcac1_g20389 [Phytophthora cactorum]KAG2777905.1 hypothetical protein PC111_g24703 [Phytophthora cactorum]KAG2868095.1 hypothetical protein PC114_g27843 [Phytophthora cactorum]